MQGLGNRGGGKKKKGGTETKGHRKRGEEDLGEEEKTGVSKRKARLPDPFFLSSSQCIAF